MSGRVQVWSVVLTIQLLQMSLVDYNAVALLTSCIVY